MKTSVLCLFLIISIVSIYADGSHRTKEEETKEKRTPIEKTTGTGKKHVEAEEESKPETADERERRIAAGKKTSEKKPVEGEKPAEGETR